MANVEETTALITGAHVDHVRRKDYLITRNEALQGSDNVGVDVDEAWCRFEIARRSAEFYMDKYFQHLKARSSRLETAPNTYFVDASDVVESRGEQLHDSEYWNMKAARDCLIKGLNDMSFWIQQLALSRQPEVRTPMGVACFSGVAITGLQQVRSEPLQALLGVGKGAALLTLVSSLAYLLHVVSRREAYSHYQKSIAQCLDAAYGWTLTDFHQRTVKKYQYQLLRRLR
ncbi:hypothetical protein BGZ57DRAFT_349825 [Hyaloscypha finlandica]|nr:hypothetical protein BGZ57DRAFT_349825 [Hyaloscypha finlandica]